jgi:hypothetical protein
VKEYAGLKFVVKSCSESVPNFNSASVKFSSSALMKFFCDNETSLMEFFVGKHINSSDHIKIIDPNWIKHLAYQNIY